MPKAKMSQHLSRHISKALIREQLADSATEDNIAGTVAESAGILPRDRVTPRCPSTDNLSTCRSWLDQLCKAEEAQIEDVGDGN